MKDNVENSNQVTMSEVVEVSEPIDLHDKKRVIVEKVVVICR